MISAWRPICLSTFPDKLLARILERWAARAGTASRDAILPISVKMFIANTDEAARALGTPLDLRQQMMTRFAEEICPRYSRATRQERAA